MAYDVISSTILKGGGVEKITVSAGGTGYVQASTTVTISGGGGTGATATVVGGATLQGDVKVARVNGETEYFQTVTII